jgi:hypothetical protein
MLVILKLEVNLNSVNSAGCVNFLNGKFSTIFNGLTVNGSASGCRSNTADL